MRIPILGRPRPLTPEARTELLEKAVRVARDPRLLGEIADVAERNRVDSLAKAVSNAHASFRGGPTRKPSPVSAQALAQRAAASLQPSSSITPPDIEAALRSQGLDMVAPFAPGTPLTPYYGYGRTPRTYDYQVARNTTTETRPDRIPFDTLLHLWKAYDVAQACTRYSINDLRSMNVRFTAMEGHEDNATKEIAEARRRLRKPDGKRFFRNWLAQNQRNLWIFDSAPIYRQRDKAGNVKYLKNISAMTIAPMLDYYGDFPESPAPAFQQFIEGVPWDWLTWDDLIYEPFWPETDSPYGTPPLETVLVNANTDLRLQTYFLDFFTKGQVPEALAMAPEGMTDPDGLAELQETYDDWTYGDQAERWGLRWLPHGTELQFYKPDHFDPELAEYVMRRTIAAYGLTPQNLGILDDVNRACYSEDTQTLTENGWKFFHQVRDGEKIATFNPDTQELEFHVPEKMHVYPYDGEMVHFSSLNVDCLVTPEHKMWAGRRSEESPTRSTVTLFGVSDALAARQAGHRNSSGWSISAVCRRLGIDRGSWLKAANGEPVRPQTAEAICSLLPEVIVSGVVPDRPVWEKVPAADLESRGDFWFADSSIWTGGVEVEWFTLPAVESGSHRKPARRIDMDTWLEFLGYIVSEGCIFGDASNCRYPVSLSRSERANPEKVRTIQACIDNLPIRFNRYTDKGGTVRWQVSDKALWTWLRANVGHKSGDKGLPALWRSLGKRQLAILFEALMLGDGHTDPSPNATNRSYATKSDRLADDVHEVALRLGYRAQRTHKLRGRVFRVNIAETRGLGYQLRSTRNVKRVLYRGSVWCFDVPPNHLFLTRRNGKVTIAGNSSETQTDQQFRVSTLPVVGYYEDLLNAVIQDDWSLPVRISFDTGREKEDRLNEAKAWQIWIDAGVASPDEPRDNVLGLPVDPENPVPRMINSQRLGPVPLSYVQEISGQLSPRTFSPDQKPTYRDFVVPGSNSPDPIEAANGQDEAALPVAGAPKVQAPLGGRPAGNAASKELTPGAPEPNAVAAPESPSADGDAGYGTVGEGSTAQGTAATWEGDFRRWQQNARNRLKKGLPPRLFADTSLPGHVVEKVWSVLKDAATREEVDAAFAKAMPKAAGVVVQALDTKRVLMIQRTPDKHDPKEAYARWEWPGGKLDQPGDTPWTGALREWQEETGAELPTSLEHVGNWTSPDGIYTGFVVTVPSEDDIDLRPDGEEVSEARWWDKSDLDDPQVRDKVTDTLDRITPMLKGWAHQPRGSGGRWRTADHVEWEKFHRHTDTIVDHYTPLVQEAMAHVLDRKAVHQAIGEAYGQSSVRGRSRAVPGTDLSKAASWRDLLKLAQRATQALADLLHRIYGDGYMRGAREAADASEGEMPPWTATVEPQTWTTWSPGTGDAAAKVAQGGLARLLANADLWIKEMTDTQVERIGDAIAEGITKGFPVGQVTETVDAIVNDAARARMIAETELCRAYAEAAMDTYRLNNVPEVRWLHEPGACARCMANVAASPQPTASPHWPSGGLPVHPGERCAIAPVLDGQGVSR